MKCIHTYTHIRCIRARATATVEFTQSQGTLHVFSSFKKNEAFVSDLLFFNLFCISVSNRGQPNLAPDQSEYEYEVFCLEEQNMYSIIYSCAVLLLNAKWAISIKAVWASNHNKHLHCKTIWFKRQIMFFVFCLGVFTGLLVLLFQSTVSAL